MRVFFRCMAKGVSMWRGSMAPDATSAKKGW